MNDKHFYYLDGWRGLAIIFLLIGHFFPVPGINLGTVGVNLFFVLSGLLMGRLLFVKEIPIAVFYRRRISRILPAHLFFVCLILIYFSINAMPINWGETFAALFFMNNYLTGELGKTSMPFGHIWSLSVEEHSYILLSMIAVIARRFQINPKWLVSAMAVGFSITGYWYWTQYSGRELDFGKWPHTEVSAFGIFVSSAMLLFLANIKIPILPIYAYPLLMAIGLALHWWSIPGPARTVFGVGIFALLINILASAPSAIKKMLEFKPLTMMGIWSFSIYLWQQPFYLASRNYGLFPGYFAVSIAIFLGIVSYYFIENPIRQYLNSFWGTNESAKHCNKSGSLSVKELPNLES